MGRFSLQDIFDNTLTADARRLVDDELTAEQIADCKDAFSLYDKDKDGYIGVKKLIKVMRCMGLNPRESEIVEIMANFNINRKGKISLGQFIEVMLMKMKTLDTEEEIRNVFRLFDKDGNGFISVSELRYTLIHMGHKLDEGEAQEILEAADADGDGELNYNEFVHWLVS